MKKTEGFTLVEMLVVISIVGILSTMIAVGVSRARSSAHDTRALADIGSLQRAIELSFIEETDYRTVLGDGCNAAGDQIVECDGTITGIIGDITLMRDLREHKGGCTSITTGCDYSVTEPATASTYQIGFWLEGGVAGYAKGAHYLTQAGIQ